MKNPWMSAWLSAANAWSGAARGKTCSEARRAQEAWLAETNRRLVELWFPAALRPQPRPVRARRSRKAR